MQSTGRASSPQRLAAELGCGLVLALAMAACNADDGARAISDTRAAGAETSETHADVATSANDVTTAPDVLADATLPSTSEATTTPDGADDAHAETVAEIAPEGDTTPDGADGGDGHDSLDPACEALPQPPYAVTELGGFSATEDFQFAPDGRLIAADDDGNLVHIARDGTRELWIPGACDGRCEGMQFLPDGDLVFARLGDGTLYRATPDGVVTPILGGLSFPNGLEVDPAGYVYVSEMTAARVRQVDPDTGHYTIIATGLYSPDGLGFSPDFATLYVAGYGVGVLYAIPLDAARHAGAPHVFAHLDGMWDIPDPIGATEDTLAPCVDKVTGDPCGSGLARGFCTSLGDALVCDPMAGTADPVKACAGRLRGDTCYVLGAYQYDACRPIDGVLTCRAGDPATVACDRAEDGDACTVHYDGDPTPVDGRCGMESGELACAVPDPAAAPCADLAVDAPCEVDLHDGRGTVVGTCGDPGTGMICVPDDPWMTACKALATGADCGFDYRGTHYEGACTRYGTLSYCEPFDSLALACRGRAIGDACTATFDDGRETTESRCWPLRGGALTCGAGFVGELDGLAVDACGNIFASEDDTGLVYRFRADGSAVALAAQLEGWWIPNLHWGRGGGFDDHTLYVTNFNAAGLYAIAVGVPEKQRPRP